MSRGEKPGSTPSDFEATHLSRGTILKVSPRHSLSFKSHMYLSYAETERGKKQQLTQYLHQVSPFEEEKRHQNVWGIAVVVRTH